MPNLDYDPHNPTDLLDQPIAEGDIVAWGTTFGRSAALCVARIEKIRFYRDSPPGGDWRKRTEDCTRAQAEGYQLLLRPIKTTGSMPTDTKYVDPPIIGADGEPTHWQPIEPKPVRVSLVKNVVKLEGVNPNDIS